MLRLTDSLLRPRGQPDLPAAREIEQIVVVKPCCLGDMLMATPVIRGLDQHFPNASITIVTGEWTQPAIETNPRIDRVIRYPEGHATKAAIQAAIRMRPFKFDMGVSLDRSPASALALRLAGIPIRVGIDSQHRGLGLTHRVIPNPGQHETELYLSTLAEIGIAHEQRFPEFAVPDELVAQIRERVPLNRERPLVVIHPGGAVNPGVAMLEKRWPATNFGELARLLAQEAGATIVLVGSESDRNAVATVREFAKAPVVDLCGQLSLAELAALTKQAALYVGNDSGTSHLASAVGTPVVAIFGPTSPRKYAPLGRRTRICAPEASWKLEEMADLRTAKRSDLPDISTVPLPSVLNACLELLRGAK
jgi:heptosyltransferase II